MIANGFGEIIIATNARTFLLKFHPIKYLDAKFVHSWQKKSAKSVGHSNLHFDFKIISVIQKLKVISKVF